MKIDKTIGKALLEAILLIASKAYPSDEYNSSCNEGQRFTHKPALHELWKNLSEQKRTLLHNAILSAEKQNEELRKETKRLSAELNALLLTPDFDKKSYLNKSIKLGVLQAKINANLSDAFTEIASRFNQQELEILAKMNEIRHHHLLEDEPYCNMILKDN